MVTDIFVKSYKLGMIMGLIISAISLIAVYICEAIAYKGCMKKAGVETWKAFIPVYNLFTMYKIVKMNVWFIIFKILTIVSSIASIVMVIGFLSDIEEFSDKIKSVEVSSEQAIESFIENDFVELMEDITVKQVPVTIISLVGGIGSLVAVIFFAIKIRTAYNLPGGFIAGMILVPIIFNFIIGYGKYEYQYTKFNENASL